MRPRPNPTRWVVPAVLLLWVPLLAVGCSSTGATQDGKERPAFSRVRPPVAFEMLRDNPGLVVLDLRSRYEFTGPIGHIRGSRNVPVDELEKNLAGLSPLKDRTFLVYCGHDDCGDQGLQVLVDAGFDEVILMDGGIDAWVMDGFGTVTGPSAPMQFPQEDSDEVVVD